MILKIVDHSSLYYLSILLVSFSIPIHLFLSLISMGLRQIKKKTRFLLLLPPKYNPTLLFTKNIYQKS